MGGEYDLYQSEDDAEGEHLEFKCHCCPDADCEADTIASPGTNGVERTQDFSGGWSGTMRSRHGPERPLRVIRVGAAYALRSLINDLDGIRHVLATNAANY